MNIIDIAFNRSRVVMLMFIMIIIAGAFAYVSIPKESEPDVPIPTFYVSITHEGISPEDAERLLVKPMEKELQSLDGLKEMRAVAAEGYASITLEFYAGYDIDQALIDVREKVDLATAYLPPDSDEPRVMEVNVALFPVISIALSGRLPEQELVSIAKKLKDDIEALSGVLEVEIGGDREEMMEIVADPSVMQTYGIVYEDITSFLRLNNRLVPAGALDVGAGRMVMKVPGVIENIEDVLKLPIKTVDGRVVTFSDVVSVRRTYKDPTSFARVDGKPALVLEVTKRLGANIIETIQDVRSVIESKRQQWPKTLDVNYMQDKSTSIKVMLNDLQNNVITAIVLVMIVAIATMGIRPAFLVGMAIPGSFLAGILALDFMDYTINIVVLFSLILSVGMLVDGAIVTTELADRKITEGMERKKAYAYGAKRMAWPIIASTATTLSVFIPLIFWPGIVGEFMKFLPITVLLTLLASMFMALIFIPVLGGIIGEKRVVDIDNSETAATAQNSSLDNIKGGTGIYIRALRPLLRHPAKVFGAALVFLFLSYAGYISFGRGVEFFPKIEPDFIQVQVLARGDLSVYEKDLLVRRVEEKLLGMDVYKTIYSRTFSDISNQQNMPLDMIGIIQLEFIDWKERPVASVIIEDVRNRLKNIAGIMAQVRQQESGPSAGKPIQIEIVSSDSKKLSIAVEKIKELMDQIDGFEDIEDSRPLPGIEWRLEINREQAARYGVDITSIGNTVQMLTTGLKIAEYQPDDAEEELDIRMRFSTKDRNLDQLLELRIPSIQGHIPIQNFVKFNTTPNSGSINRVNAQRVMSLKSDVKDGILVDDQVKKLKDIIAKNSFDKDVNIHFKGQDVDQKEAGEFLTKAFITAIFLMVIILVAQFNSFYQAGLILSAIIFSTAGVLLGLLITGNPFGIVMGGIGVIALAGIVVNNNIILIDTYNSLKEEGIKPMEAILQTVAQRTRPVLLTSATTILGLLPMVLGMNIDLIEQEVTFGAPSTQWWTQLSSAIVGGLTFATILTLILTPALLMLGENVAAKFKTIKNRGASDE